MGRSQRHMVFEQGASAAGEIHAQGAVAPGIAMQVDPAELNVMEPGVASPPYLAVLDPDPRADVTGIEVPAGPPGGPLAGSSLTGPVPEELQPPEPPEPSDPAPVIIGMNPDTIPAGMPDMTSEVNGAGFVDGAVVIFGGTDMATDFVSDNQLRIIVPSGAAEPAAVPVRVRNADGQLSNEINFLFDEAGRQAVDYLGRGQRVFPSNPFAVRRVDDHEDGIAILLSSPSDFEEGNLDIKPGDAVLVEATGNTSINGEYIVVSVDGLTIIVDNTYVLAAPIDSKGRVTVIEGA